MQLANLGIKAVLQLTALYALYWTVLCVCEPVFVGQKKSYFCSDIILQSNWFKLYKCLIADNKAEKLCDQPECYSSKNVGLGFNKQHL